MFIKDHNKTALYTKEEHISYKELLQKIKSFSSDLNIKKGDRVSIFSENRPEWIYSFFSIWDKEGIVVPIDFMSTPYEVAYILNDCKPSVVFCSEATEEVLLEAVKKLDYKPEIKKFESLNLKDAEETALTQNDKNEVAAIIYTSGTTGNPKGVMLTFDNFLSNLEEIEKTNIANKNDRTVAILPFHHAYPLTLTMLSPLYLGAGISFLEELSSEAILNTLKRDKITVLIGVPRLYTLFHRNIFEKINSNFLARNLFKLAKKINNQQLSRKIFNKVHQAFGGNIKYFVSGGAKLDEEIAKDLWALGFTILEGYGLTETSPIISFNRPNKIKLGSVGIPLEDVRVKIVEDEIVVKGRNVMKGYYNKPEETAEVLKDGWLYTGDLGKIDEDGFLYVTGRKKEIIVLPSGKNINPEEIENKILKMTDLISEMAIMLHNNQLIALIYPDLKKVKQENIVNIEETLKWQVIDKYNQSVPPYKRISGIKIINRELPKTRLGKIRRFLLPKFVEEIEKKKPEKIEEPSFEEYRLIKNYLSKVVNREVYPDEHLEIDLGMDSLEKVEFQVFVEKTFGIKLTDEDLANHPTVKEISEFIRKKKTKVQYEEINWKKVFEEDVPIEISESPTGVLVFKKIIKPIARTYFRLEVSGVENIPDSPFILAPNHQSYLDGFLILASVPDKTAKDLYFLAEESNFKSSLRKWLAKHFHILLININKNLKESLQKTAMLLKMKKNVVIFPEGARTRDGNLLPFKKSFAILSKELNVPIVPVVIKGAYQSFPIGAKFPKPMKIEIKFLKPVYPDDKSYEQIMKEVRNKMENQYN